MFEIPKGMKYETFYLLNKHLYSEADQKLLAEKFELLRRAMFLVMPSRFEGFPLTLVEAFCFQMPVILFAIPELAWLPDTCCVKVTPFDEAAFGRAILELARDHERRHAMGGTAKLFARQFSWDDLARKYEESFETALQTR